jgi:hypothetical protein
MREIAVGDRSYGGPDSGVWERSPTANRTEV